MDSAPVNLQAYGRLIRSNRNFRLLWFAQIVSEIGDWLYSVAIYSLLLELTGSAQSIAIAFVLQVLPQAFVAPTAGVLNDRLSRRRIMIFADWARAAITFLMLFAQTRETVILLYLLLFFETVFWALFEPAHHAVIPNITTGDHERLVANALSSTTWSFNLAIGAAIGGLIAVAFGRSTVFVLNAASFVVSALLVRRMRFNEPHMTDLPPMKVKDLFDFSPILEGFLYVKQDRRLMATLFVKTGLAVMGANWILLPVMGERIFPVSLGGSAPNGMLGMSILLGSRGVGAILGPLIASYWTGANLRRFRIGIIAAFLLGAAGYLALSLAPTLLLACAAVMLAHAGGSIAWTFSTTLLQIQTADKFRGRVFSAEFACAMVTMSVVSFSAGQLTDAGVSVRTLAACTGGLILIPALMWTLAQRLWSTE